MKVRYSRWSILCIFMLVVSMCFIGRLSLADPPPVPEGYSTEIIHVRFFEGTDVDPPTDPLTPELLNSVDSIIPLFTLSETELDRLRAAGEESSGNSLPDLKMWHHIKLKDGTDAAAFLEDLKALITVDTAEHAALPAPPGAVTPDFTANQGYSGPAPDGIDAAFSCTITGGNGSGITVYDVEYSWNQSHEDLSKATGVSLLLNSGDTPSDPFGDNNHGTAVLGELIADNDTKGVTGLCWGSNIGMAPAMTANLGYNPANAILLAVADGNPGDVILIEQQTWVCGTGDYGPLEWISSVFDAIQTAVANRIVVVEAAGNGDVDLDQAGCGTTFDRTTRDSGAIIVGAGGSPSGNNLQRLWFSSYGDRVDVQAWGEDVMTTGYGSHYTNPDDPNNPNYFYRSTFNGTSSASPMVAAAAANLQGIALNMFGTPLLPFQVRSLLVETGTPQLAPGTGHIGPRPDLQNTIAQLTTGAIDLFIIVDLSSSFADDLPVFQAQAPGIIASITSANPNVKFGLARFEDYPINPFGDANSGDVAYERVVDLTFDTTLVLNAIASLTWRWGKDLPQSQLPALYQAATGAGQDLSGEGHPGASIPAGQQANFRSGVTKLFLLWTDAAFHLQGDPGDIPYPGPTFAETVTAINALDPPKVISICSGDAGLADLDALAVATNSLAGPEGLDCNGDGIPDRLEGETLVCEIAETGEGIGIAIVNSVKAAIEASTPVAQCKDMTVPTDPGLCTTAEVSIDDGSYDPEGEEITLTQSPEGPYPLGETEVTLKATDEAGLTGYCTATVAVVDQTPPTITCPANITIECDQDADPAITGEATATDNCDLALVITYSDETVSGSCPEESIITRTWTATDDSGNSSNCVQTINVVDTTPPEIQCNAPDTITPPDAPSSFTATATDNCGDVNFEIISYDCYWTNPAGKIKSKLESCVVEISEDHTAITIVDSGGVGDNITWTIVATDSCGNTTTQTCTVVVVNPGKK